MKLIGWSDEAIKRIVERVVAERIDEALEMREAEVEAAFSERITALVDERLAAVLPAAVRRAVPSWVNRTALRGLDYPACVFADQYARDLHVEVDEDGEVIRWLDADGSPVTWRGDRARDLYVQTEGSLTHDPFERAYQEARAGLGSIGLDGGVAFQRDVARELLRRGRGKVIAAVEVATA